MSGSYSPAEVYGPEGTLIGHLQGVDVNTADRTLVLALDHMLRIALDKSLRNRRIDKAVMVRHGLRLPEFKAEHGIPEHAEAIEEHDGCHIRFRWVVLKTDDLETSELLFDDDRFEPAGRACAASAAESAWWAKHRTMHAGGLVSSLTEPRIGSGVNGPGEMDCVFSFGSVLSRIDPEMAALHEAVAKAGAGMHKAMEDARVRETFVEFGEALTRDRERTVSDMMRIGDLHRGRVR